MLLSPALLCASKEKDPAFWGAGVPMAAAAAAYLWPRRRTYGRGGVPMAAARPPPNPRLPSFCSNALKQALVGSDR